MKEDIVVIFDVDGTLFDTKPGIIKALNEVLNSFGENAITLAEEDKWIGPPVRDSFKMFTNMTDEEAEKATMLYRQIYTNKYISESTLYKGMNEVLETLKNIGCRLCIATMKTSEQIERLLFLKKMTKTFEIVQTAARNGSKSKTDMLTEIKQKIPNAKYYYMIGDTNSDLEAAEKANCVFIATTYGYGHFYHESKFINVKNASQLLPIIMQKF